MPSQLAAGERAAFHGVPGDGVLPLSQAEALATESGDIAGAAHAAWLLGICHMACGQYGQALALLTATASDPRIPERWRALAATVVASTQRQLGRHSEGLEWDRGALDAGSGHPDVLCKAQLGLGSDLVGLGDAEGARQALIRAEGLAVDQESWWRQRIGLHWLRAEVCLLGEDPEAARVAAARALAAAETANSPRYVAKSLMLAGVAQAALGEVAGATASLRRAAVLAEGLGALPLVWPSYGLLGALLAGSDPQESQHCLATAGAAVRAIAADLPAVLADPWVARREIRELLG